MIGLEKESIGSNWLSPEIDTDSKMYKMLCVSLQENRSKLSKELCDLKANMKYPESYDGEREKNIKRKNHLEDRIEAIDKFLGL